MMLASARRVRPAQQPSRARGRFHPCEHVSSGAPSARPADSLPSARSTTTARGSMTATSCGCRRCQASLRRTDGRLRRWQSRGLIVAPSAPAVPVMCERSVIFTRTTKPSLRGSRSTICGKIEGAPGEAGQSGIRTVHDRLLDTSLTLHSHGVQRFSKTLSG